ncbi:MAG: phytanoyl-CoA dioxygenase family protein, partial [Bacteroidota bacterium]
SAGDEVTDHQIATYHKDGFLVIENLLDPEEVKQLSIRLNTFQSLKHLPNVICEEGGDIRSIFAPNRHDELYERLYRLQRLVAPTQQLVEEEVYLYQYKLNLKNAFSGKAWEWHQDFAYWHLDDGVQEPKMISVMIYLSDVRSYQGPLMVIPGSHLFDVVRFQDKEHLRDATTLLNSLGADLKYTVHQHQIAELAKQNGIKVLEYQAGTGIFFHPNLCHASTGNMSPFKRDTSIITYNSVANPPKHHNRPSFVCSNDYRPVASLSTSLVNAYQ